MNLVFNPARLLSIVTLGLFLSACSSVGEKVEEALNKPLEYKQSRDAEPLEIPPDLTRTTLRDTMAIPSGGASGSTTFSAYNATSRKRTPNQGSGVLPGAKDVSIAREGNRRWLVVQGEPDAIWSQVRDFWFENGFLLVLEDPEIGIMETEWAENRAEIPLDRLQGFLGSVLDNVYDAGSRDKFRVRLERGLEAGTTELHLTHRRAEELLEGDSIKWEYRPRDPEIEIEMLSRIMVYMGISSEVAGQRLATRQAPKVKSDVRLVNGQTGAVLQMTDGFSQSWRIIGQTLDQIGFSVEDRDRSRGIYYVRYNDPEVEKPKEGGWLSKLAFWSSDDPPPQEQFQILVSAGERGTRVTVQNEQGLPDATGTGNRILALLHEQLR